MSKKKQKLTRFMGYRVTRHDMVAMATLLSYVPADTFSGRLDCELDFWAFVERTHGITRDEGEAFHAAIHRVAKIIRSTRRDLRKPRAPRAPRAPRIIEVTDAAAQTPSKRPKAKGEYRPTPAEKGAFYASWEWRRLRMEVLKAQGRRCLCCGAAPGDRSPSGKVARIVVDHIRPLSLFWHRRLDRTNLQVLCDECNMGKGAWDQSDYRPADDDGDLDAIVTDPLTAEYRAIMGNPMGEA